MIERNRDPNNGQQPQPHRRGFLGWGAFAAGAAVVGTGLGVLLRNGCKEQEQSPAADLTPPRAPPEALVKQVCDELGLRCEFRGPESASKLFIHVKQLHRPPGFGMDWLVDESIPMVLPMAVMSQRGCQRFVTALERRLGDRLVGVGFEGEDHWDGEKHAASLKTAVSSRADNEFLKRDLEHDTFKLKHELKALNDKFDRIKKGLPEEGDDAAPPVVPPCKSALMLTGRADLYEKARRSTQSIPSDYRAACAALSECCREAAGALGSSARNDDFVRALLKLEHLSDARFALGNGLAKRCFGAEKGLNAIDQPPHLAIGGGVVGQLALYSLRESAAVERAASILKGHSNGASDVIAVLYGDGHDFGDAIGRHNDRVPPDQRFALCDVSVALTKSEIENCALAMVLAANEQRPGK